MLQGGDHAQFQLIQTAYETIKLGDDNPSTMKTKFRFENYDEKLLKILSVWILHENYYLPVSSWLNSISWVFANFSLGGPKTKVT